MKIADQYAYEAALMQLKDVYERMAELKFRKAELESSLKCFAERHFYDEERRDRENKELTDELSALRRRLKEGSEP